MHAFRKLNDATISAQMHNPRTYMVLDARSGMAMFSVIELIDGFFQILMRQSDIPLTAVSTLSGLLRNWLVIL